MARPEPAPCVAIELAGRSGSEADPPAEAAEPGEHDSSDQDEIRGSRRTCLGWMETRLRVNQRRTHFEVRERMHITMCFVPCSSSLRRSVHSATSIVAAGFQEGPRKSYMAHSTGLFFATFYIGSLYQLGTLYESGFFKKYIFDLDSWITSEGWISWYIESWVVFFVERWLGYGITGFGFLWVLVTAYLMLARKPYIVVACRAHPVEEAIVPYFVGLPLPWSTGSHWVRKLLELCLDSWEADVEKLLKDKELLPLCCENSMNGLRVESKRAGVIEGTVVVSTSWFFSCFPMLQGTEMLAYLPANLKRIVISTKELLAWTPLGHPLIRLGFPLGEETLRRVHSEEQRRAFVAEVLRLKLGDEEDRFLGWWRIPGSVPEKRRTFMQRMSTVLTGNATSAAPGSGDKRRSILQRMSAVLLRDSHDEEPPVPPARVWSQQFEANELEDHLDWVRLRIYKDRHGTLHLEQELGGVVACGVLESMEDEGGPWRKGRLLLADLSIEDVALGTVRLRVDEDGALLLSFRQQGQEAWLDKGIASPVEHIFRYAKTTIQVQNQIVVILGWHINWWRFFGGLLTVLCFLIYPWVLVTYADPTHALLSSILAGGFWEGLGRLVKSFALNVAVVIFWIVAGTVASLSAFEYGEQIFFREDLTHVRVDRTRSVPWCCCPLWCGLICRCGLCGRDCPGSTLELKFAAFPLPGLVRKRWPLEDARRLQAVLCAVDFAHA